MYNKSYRDKKPGGSWKKKEFGHRSEGFSESFETVCSQCHDACRVPFKPNGRKPVLCNRCFRKNGPQDREMSFDKPSFRGDRPGRSFDRPDRDPVEQRLKFIEQKLDTILEMLQSAE